MGIPVGTVFQELACFLAIPLHDLVSQARRFPMTMHKNLLTIRMRSADTNVLIAAVQEIKMQETKKISL
jgi:hypothetical protein